jgi:hypothetical protein
MSILEVHKIEIKPSINLMNVKDQWTGGKGKINYQMDLCQAR